MCVVFRFSTRKNIQRESISMMIMLSDFDQTSRKMQNLIYSGSEIHDFYTGYSVSTPHLIYRKYVCMGKYFKSYNRCTMSRFNNF